MNHKIKLGTLMLSGIGTMIGSGWLFGAANAAAVAGPAAIFSWIIGALLISIIGINLIEVSSISPIRMGSIGHYLKYTHGSLTGFIAEWTILIGFISSIPSEATASTQYLSDWNYPWAHTLYNHANGTLTVNGLIISSILCIFYFLMNYFSLKLLSRSIKAITIFKLIVPILTIVTLLLVSYHSHNFHAIGNHSIAPYGYSGILTAVTSAGVIYAFFGFQAPITFASEAENPKRDIPLALLGAIIICTIIYILLQYAYIVSMPNSLLVANGGWAHLNLSSPFAVLAITVNLNFTALCLYADAFVSPSGTGIIYSSLSSRVICGISNHTPKILGKIDPKTSLPKAALIFVLIVSIFCLWALPSWQKLAEVISVGYVLCFALIPICAASFRKIAPTAPNSHAIRFKGIQIFSLLGFILCSYMLYWSKWPLNAEVISVVLCGVPLYIYYSIKRKEKYLKQLLHCSWIIIYLISIAAFSYFGSKDFGGIGYIPNGVDHIILAIIALIFYFWGKAMSYKTPEYIEFIENAKN
jgi:amino acid transporter